MNRTSLEIMEDILTFLEKKGPQNSSAVQHKIKINSRVSAAKLGMLSRCGAVVRQEGAKTWAIAPKGETLLVKIAEVNKDLQEVEE